MDDCHRLKARAEMLHREALLGLEQALDAGPASSTFKGTVEIPNCTEEMVFSVEQRLAEGVLITPGWRKRGFDGVSADALVGAGACLPSL